ncbi:MAG: hypothetical protein ABI665_16455 [Vicinamibacterales bacterium]
MTIKTARVVVFCSTMLVSTLAVTMDSRRAMPRHDDGGAVSLFRDRVAAYGELRQQVVTDLLKVGLDPNAADYGQEFRNRLGLAIRDARQRAKPGEIFCPEIAGDVRRKVWTSLQGVDDILEEVPAVSRVRVNDFYPEGEPLATVPPSLLRRLEPLPPELQYRFLANALILLDIDTGLIVDFIPDAFQRSS